MKKSCCVEDGNITPKHSSCSMVLRSDCSHGPCKKHLAVSKLQKQDVTLLKRNNDCCLTEAKLLNSESTENSQLFNSYLRSSIEHFASKSVHTFSAIKESLCSRFEQSESQDSNISLKTGVLLGDSKELKNGFSSYAGTCINNNSLSQEECTYVTNNCIISKNSGIMSRSRDFSRSSSAVNALSDSETEGISVQENLRKRRSRKSLSSVGKKESQLANNHSNHTSTITSTSLYNTAHNSIETSQRTQISPCIATYQTPINSAVYKRGNSHSSHSDAASNGSPFSPSVIDISTVQYSPIDKLRWFLWSNIYLKIIKCVNFDAWLLSRLHSHKKLVTLLILIPLLIYLRCGAVSESQINIVENLSASAIKVSSYIYSIVSSPFVNSQENTSQISSEENTCSRKFSEILYYIWLAIANFFSNFFVKIRESESVKEKISQTVIHTDSLNHKEHLKLIVDQVWDERFNDLLAKFQESHSVAKSQAEKEDIIGNVQNDIKKLRSEFQSLTEFVQKLEKNVNLKSESSLKDGNIIENHELHITSINAKMKDYEDKLASLSDSLKSINNQKQTESDFAALFEKYFLIALKSIVDGDKDTYSPYYLFNKWLQSKLSVEKSKLSDELKLEFERMKSSSYKFDETIQRTIENVVHRNIESIKKEFTSTTKTDISLEDAYSMDIVKKLIKEAILLYDADKTGKVDYALESGGGSVLSTRCSESYSEKYGTISVLGFPLWSTHNSPRIAIQPDMQPGQCWAFKGSQGFLVIQLSYTIHPTGFTLEHIPVSLSPSGSIDSAPKNFSVWGLFTEKDNEGKLLGKYTYDQEGGPLQYFAVQNTYNEPFSFVELKIHSNHGNLEYTCLYRFRVHGKQPKN